MGADVTRGEAVMVYQLYPALTLGLVPVVVVPAAAVIGSWLYLPPAKAPEGV